MSRRLRLFFRLVLAMALAIAPVDRSTAQVDDAPAGWTIEQLTTSLASVKQVDGVFHERKDMTVLEQPLFSSGFLHYRAPNYLEKQVLQPEPQTYRIDGDKVFVETPEIGRREFSLDAYPGVRPLAESIRATLAGDQASLAQYFKLSLSGQREVWSLSLQPTDERIADRINRIIISGMNNQLLRVETIETNGDRTVMDVTPIVP